MHKGILCSYEKTNKLFALRWSNPKISLSKKRKSRWLPSYEKTEINQYVNFR